MTVHVRSALDNQTSKIRCSQFIVTVPLGVLEAGAIEFDPEPKSIRNAVRALQFGQVYRVTFRFSEPFLGIGGTAQGNRIRDLARAVFPTWWTSHPVISPLLTGWSAGPAAQPLIGLDRPAVISQALASLRRILNRKIPRPLAAYFHDWHADPFFRGAYSYVPVNALPARQFLRRPVDRTLFFAGEATDITGGGTVHGAIG